MSQSDLSSGAKYYAAAQSQSIFDFRTKAKTKRDIRDKIIRDSGSLIIELDPPFGRILGRSVSSVSQPGRREAIRRLNGAGIARTTL